MIGFQDFLDLLKEYTGNFSFQGILRVLVDILLTLIIFIIIYKILRIKFHHKKVYLTVLIGFIAYIIINIMQFSITASILNFLLFWSFGILIIVYGQDIKYLIENAFHSTRNENLFTTDEEKQQVINTLINTSMYLSKRKIGALMTLEREDNLNSFIEKAIVIKGNISEELLTTIFTVGTATHDGAVIVRKNKIMCAGAYLPSTDKYDIPKSLGTRHRAAIGLSERYDAITIVVSEETGNVSITNDGVIEYGLSEAQLREILERYMIVK